MIELEQEGASASVILSREEDRAPFVGPEASQIAKLLIPVFLAIGTGAVSDYDSEHLNSVCISEAVQRAVDDHEVAPPPSWIEEEPILESPIWLSDRISELEGRNFRRLNDPRR